MTSFAQTLDVIESLRRAELVATVKQSRKEFAAGKCRPASVAAIMRQVK
jgi:hypothetical protein